MTVRLKCEGLVKAGHHAIIRRILWPNENLGHEIVCSNQRFSSKSDRLAKKKPAPKPDSNAETSQSDDSATMPDFEETLSQIEMTVRDLESGELSLDESLRQYESAVGKMRQCYQLLEVAERRVSVLSGFDAEGQPVTEPLDEEVSGDDAASLIEKQQSRGQRRGAASSGPVAGDRVAGDTE